MGFMTIAAAAVVSTNMWVAKWDTPYGIPPYEQLKFEEYIDAVKIGIEEERREIADILACTEKPTFANTLAPLARAGQTLSRIDMVFGNLFSVERNPTLEALRKEAIPLRSAFSAEVSTNKALFARIKAVHDGDRSSLTAEENTILDRKYRTFVRSGALLPPEKQKRLQEISRRFSELSLEFSRNVLADNNAFKEKFGVDMAEYYTEMGKTADRARRKAMYEEYVSRGFHPGEHDNRPVVLETMKLRIELAKMLGFKSAADYFIDLRMAKTAAKAEEFLAPIMKAANAAARREIDEMQKVMDEDVAKGILPAGSKMEPWDWEYYSEIIRRRKFSFDPEETRKYFKIDNVVNGLFTAANRLYGLKFEKIEDFPSYRREATAAYKVMDADGSYVGTFFTDYHPRSTKASGAWMSILRRQMHTADGKDIRPVIINCCNVGEYLTLENVTTLFHEFGHALHGLLSRCEYPTVSCTGGYSDYNEIFSQFNENWARQPWLLAQYAKDDKGNVIPNEIIEKINAQRGFNAGIYLSKLCSSALVDLRWHELDSVDGIDVEAFEKKVCDDIGLVPELRPRHRTCHFKHVFSGGYSAAYYTYIWAEVLDMHLFSTFEAFGDPWNSEHAMKFRRTFLERGGTIDPMVNFKSFTGCDPDEGPYLKSKGMK